MPLMISFNRAAVNDPMLSILYVTLGLYVDNIMSASLTQCYVGRDTMLYYTERQCGIEQANIVSLQDNRLNNLEL